MKRAVVLLVLLVFCAGCSRWAGEAPPVKVGFLLSSMVKERYHKDRAAFTQRVEELGGTVTFESAEGDSEQERTLGSRMLADGVKCLVVQAVDREAATDLVDQAHKAHVPIVAYDRIVPGVPFDWGVVHDSEAVGKAQAEYALRAMGAAGGQVVILRGPRGNPVAEAITRANLEVLRAAPGVEVVEVVVHRGWNPEDSARSTRRLVRDYPKLRAVLANSSALARGAVEVLREAGSAGRIYVAGADADLTNCQWVALGLQGMDVLKEIGPLASGAADLALALARKQDPSTYLGASAPGHRVIQVGMVPTLVIPVIPFDRTNLEAVVVDAGFHPREAIFPAGPAKRPEAYPGG